MKSTLLSLLLSACGSGGQTCTQCDASWTEGDDYECVKTEYVADEIIVNTPELNAL